MVIIIIIIITKAFKITTTTIPCDDETDTRGHQGASKESGNIKRHTNGRECRGGIKGEGKKGLEGAPINPIPGQ